jgi:hypothetical protein
MGRVAGRGRQDRPSRPRRRGQLEMGYHEIGYGERGETEWAPVA